MRSSINRPPTPDAEEDQGKEPTLQEIINIKLIESGEKERLKELLRERLIECGWRDEMKALCRHHVEYKVYFPCLTNRGIYKEEGKAQCYCR
ncbi:PREDICTED: transcription and mRNA export factor SUS1-like isoform X3 [Nelumbo nucifera]|uniref:Transcription and mRNA export factor SUS1-like isoform X3 n=1 Tax=Nelumbo nucifera TaxID=4432 RepID=A0A1U7ZD93_NELNU|nr:PREDICTED: transcription and mRNA export factor SUS1-like isoform X3 [Nelumbo nucifera]